MAVNLDDFNVLKDCVYKNEHYSVRDNGAVLRHALLERQPRPSDNNWTFGNLNSKTGYLEIASVRIHRIVATAFHGEPPTKEHVADHIDTNKQNNRPENLRWVTRLENILLNPITAKRIALVCGSVEAFLADPARFRDKFQEPSMKWMQTVSIGEAQISLERLLTWAKSDKHSSGKTLDDWIFKNERSTPQPQDYVKLVKSLTLNAVQKDWKTPSEFPCCPAQISERPIYSYFQNIKVGGIFSRNDYSDSIVADCAISKDETTLWLMCNAAEPKAVKPWSLAQVTYKDNLFVHVNLGSFFQKDGVEKHFTIAQGLEWEGGDTFDDLT